MANNYPSLRFARLRIGIAALAAATLVACAVPPLNKSGPIPAGTPVSLNVPVAIPAGDAHAGVGPGFTPSELDYPVTCALEVRTVSRGDTVVQPDQFTVLGTSPDREILTGGGKRFTGGRGFGEGTGLVYIISNIYLQSPRQPDVLRVSCRQLRDTNASRFLSESLVREALGRAMTLGG